MNIPRDRQGIYLNADGQPCLICTVCHVEKLLDEFIKVPHKINGHRQPCRKCLNAQALAMADQIRQNKGITPCDEPVHIIESGHLGMKCRKCDIEKPLEDFTKSNKVKRGYSRVCKACNNFRTQRFTQADQNFHEKRQTWRDNSRDALRASAKAWAKAHPEKVRLNGHRRRTLERGLPVDFTEADRQYMLQYFGYACAICGRQEGLFDWILADDHWIPLTDSTCPGTVVNNMVPLCDGIRGCNTSKNKFQPDIWLVKKFGQQKAKNIQKKIAAFFVKALEHKHQQSS